MKKIKIEFSTDNASFEDELWNQEVYCILKKLADLSTYDSLLDGLTFDDLILAVHCNCKDITPAAVQKELDDIMKSRLQDMKFLLENNMDEIIVEARKGREQ